MQNYTDIYYNYAGQNSKKTESEEVNSPDLVNNPGIVYKIWWEYTLWMHAIGASYTIILKNNLYIYSFKQNGWMKIIT